MKFETEDILTPKQRIRSFIDTAKEDRWDIIEAANTACSVSIRADNYIWLVRALKQEYPKNV